MGVGYSYKYFWFHITMIWGHKWGYYVSGTHCQVPFLNLGCVLVTCRTCLKWGFNRETVEMKASNIGIITNMCWEASFLFNRKHMNFWPAVISIKVRKHISIISMGVSTSTTTCLFHQVKLGWFMIFNCISPTNLPGILRDFTGFLERGWIGWLTVLKSLGSRSPSRWGSLRGGDSKGPKPWGWSRRSWLNGFSKQAF